MLLRIITEHQIAENEHAAGGEELRQTPDHRALGLVCKMMKCVVGEDLVDPHCVNVIGKVLSRADMEIEVGMFGARVCGSPDHLFRRIDSVSRPYGRGERDKLSARATPDIKHDVLGLGVEEVEDLPHTLPPTWIAVSRVPFCT